eukprot:1165787-Pleurochrysis_carterae.AAC.1
MVTRGENLSRVDGWKKNRGRHRAPLSNGFGLLRPVNTKTHKYLFASSQLKTTEAVSNGSHHAVLLLVACNYFQASLYL